MQSLLSLADAFTLSRPKELFQATIQYLAIAECERRSARIGQLCDEAESHGDWEKVILFMKERQVHMQRIEQLRGRTEARVLL
jgi:hypothetical protein